MGRCTVASYTANARRNYADGLVYGLNAAVKAGLKKREQERVAKLKRAQELAERWRKMCERGARDGEEANERARRKQMVKEAHERAEQQAVEEANKRAEEAN